MTRKLCYVAGDGVWQGWYAEEQPLEIERIVRELSRTC